MSEEKKIIIDEDWKSQVEAEKQAAASEPSGSAGEPEASAPGATDQPGSAAADAQDPPMPPASFGMLVSSLATEAIMAMGQVPHPATGETTVRRNQAQYLIDTLDVLKQKTAGNLTPEEAGALDDVLHQLRMAFIAAG
ncbi:MAG: DUF1844 domain-containing protein [Planctomycetota bacterium]